MPEFEIGLFLREDGTVDWDEARTKGGEVAKFGQEVQKRLSIYLNLAYYFVSDYPGCYH